MNIIKISKFTSRHRIIYSNSLTQQSSPVVFFQRGALEGDIICENMENLFQERKDIVDGNEISNKPYSEEKTAIEHNVEQNKLLILKNEGQCNINFIDDSTRILNKISGNNTFAIYWNPTGLPVMSKQTRGSQ